MPSVLALKIYQLKEILEIPQQKKLKPFLTKQLLIKIRVKAITLKAGLDFYADKKTTIGVVLSGYINPGKNTGENTTQLKNKDGGIDSILYATNYSKNLSTNFGTNFNFRHVFDSTKKK
ncbi:MAG: hypothetical protein WKF59_24590 [Chitinophagaceae bacterium]